MKTDNSLGTSKTSAKERILDAAEELFSLNGYHGVSLRDISLKAKTKLALPNYHFGTKTELMRQVIARRQIEFCNEVNASLDAACAAAKGRPLTIEAIIDAYVTPVLMKCVSGDQHWRNYMRILGNITKLAMEGEVAGDVPKYFDPYLSRIARLLQEALPGYPKKQIFLSLYFLQSSLIYTLGETILGQSKAIDRISDGLCDSSDIVSIRAALIPYFSAGFHHLITTVKSDS